MCCAKTRIFLAVYVYFLSTYVYVPWFSDLACNVLFSIVVSVVSIG